VFVVQGVRKRVDEWDVFEGVNVVGDLIEKGSVEIRVVWALMNSV
jgi:hypothetical protein